MALAKAADLKRDGEKATGLLEKGIEAYSKGKPDAKGLKVLQSQYDKWKDILVTAEKKKQKWDETDVKEQLKFEFFLKEFKAIGKKFDAEFKNLANAIPGYERALKYAQTKLTALLESELGDPLKEAQDAITQAQFAFVRENQKAINHHYAIAMKILSKELPALFTPAGEQKLIKEVAENTKVVAEDLAADPGIKKELAALTTQFKTLCVALKNLQGDVEELEKEMKLKEGSSTDINASKEYKEQLSALQKDFLAGLQKSTKFLKQARSHMVAIVKLEDAATKVDQGDAGELAKEIHATGREIASALKEVYEELDTKLGVRNRKYEARLHKAGIVKGDIQALFVPLAAKGLKYAGEADRLWADIPGRLQAMLKNMQALGKNSVVDKALVASSKLQPH